MFQPPAPLIHPFSIGGIPLPSNLVLAPMAGVTDGPFRFLCQGLGVGLTVSELASSRAILRGNRKTVEMLAFQGEVRPFAAQIFGADPDTMAEAARRVEAMGVADMIDINMGCPVAKVVKTGAGSALMKTPDLAARVIRAVREAVKVPVTVKFRLGWTEDTINVQEFARMAVDAGAAAICVHARTRQAGYSGTAQWQRLEGLQDICGAVPFIANGDLTCRDDLARVREISGCTAFMIGRGALGRPWIFSELVQGTPDPSPGERFRVFREHLLEMLMEHGNKGVPLFRVHLFSYLKGGANAAHLRKYLAEERDPTRVLELGQAFFHGRPLTVEAA